MNFGGNTIQPSTGLIRADLVRRGIWSVRSKVMVLQRIGLQGSRFDLTPGAPATPLSQKD